MTFEQLIHPDDLDNVWKKYLRRISGEKPSDHYILNAVRKDGTELQIEVISSLITYKGKPAIIGTVIDITEQFEEEKRIDKAVTYAQERERQQISMELHDNVKQIMAASMLNIDFLKMNLKNEKKDCGNTGKRQGLYTRRNRRTAPDFSSAVAQRRPNDLVGRKDQDGSRYNER